MALMQQLLDQHPGPLPIKGTFQCLSTEVFDFIVTGVSVRKPNTALGVAGVEIILSDHTGKEGDVAEDRRHARRRASRDRLAVRPDLAECR